MTTRRRRTLLLGVVSVVLDCAFFLTVVETYQQLRQASDRTVGAVFFGFASAILASAIAAMIGGRGVRKDGDRGRTSVVGLVAAGIGIALLPPVWLIASLAVWPL